MTYLWLDALHELDRAGTNSVLVTVVAARGSTPREAGCKMLVTRDALFGTIGGGNLEFICTDAARDMLDGAEGPLLRDFPLGPALGQCCGGHVSVLFEPMRPARRSIALFGAGHVGRALVRVLGELPLRIAWFDPRPDVFPPALPRGVTSTITPDPATQIMRLAPNTLVLVTTHDHQLDYAIVAAALPRSDLAGVWLIGSATKRARFVRRLAQQGLDSAAIARLTCPIGLPGVGGKLPAEIAIAVAAQILQQPSPRPIAATPRADHAGCGDCPAPCRTPSVPA